MTRWLAAAAFLISASASADHVPGHATLEWGAGIAALSHPDYRGSSHTRSRLLPLPYIKYRGERLRVDDGIEGRLFKTPDLLLSVSGNGSLPSSQGNAERAGMEELDATVEFGPSLEYRLLHDDDSSLWLELPYRFAITIGEKIDHIGAVFHPRLAWRKPAMDKYDWKLRIAGGPLYADEEYHGYYYDVSQSEVTVTRPAYTADGGYSGLRVDFSLSRRIGKAWLGGFVRYDSLRNSEIEDSPLVTDISGWMAGLGLAWVFSEQ